MTAHAFANLNVRIPKPAHYQMRRLAEAYDTSINHVVNTFLRCITFNGPTFIGDFHAAVTHSEATKTVGTEMFMIWREPPSSYDEAAWERLLSANLITGAVQLNDRTAAFTLSTDGAIMRDIILCRFPDDR